MLCACACVCVSGVCVPTHQLALLEKTTFNDWIIFLVLSFVLEISLFLVVGESFIASATESLLTALLLFCISKA